jgi:hypothetical protein
VSAGIIAKPTNSVLTVLWAKPKVQTKIPKAVRTRDRNIKPPQDSQDEVLPKSKLGLSGLCKSQNPDIIEPDETLKLEGQNRAMSNHAQAYLREANRQFLRDSGYTTPVEAVEAGAKTIVQWCELLTAIRNAFELNDPSRMEFKKLHQAESNDPTQTI